MGRNLIQRPRFFVDFPQYWRAKGIFPKSLYGYNDGITNQVDADVSPSLFGLDLSQQFEVVAPAGTDFQIRIWINGGSDTTNFNITDGEPMHAINEFERINYCSIFGHNLKSQNIGVVPVVLRGQEGETSHDYIKPTDSGYRELLNCKIAKPDAEAVNHFTPEYDGTTIFKWEDGWEYGLSEGTGLDKLDAIKALLLKFRKMDGTEFEGTEVISFSGLSFGRTFTMPRSPDLKTSIKYDYGIKSRDGLDGSTFEQIDWVEPKRLPTNNPAFYVDNNYEPIHDYNTNYLQGADRDMITATGRRTWSMNFTALANSELFPANRMESFYSDYVESGDTSTGIYDGDENGITDFAGTHGAPGDGGGEGYNYFNSNISRDKSLYSMLINRTLGGSLPMIFQSFTDSNGYGDNNPGEFAIVKLAKRGLQFNANTFNTYNIGLTVRESW